MPHLPGREMRPRLEPRQKQGVSQAPRSHINQQERDDPERVSRSITTRDGCFCFLVLLVSARKGCDYKNSNVFIVIVATVFPAVSVIVCYCS